MAQMFPSNGPVANQSRTAEPLLYHALAKQLSDEFVVIHSLPWLAQVAKSVDNRSVPTGELDFLILHPSLGILAIEVKGGRIAFERNVFFVQRTGQIIDPVNQVRRSVHALARWIVGAGGPAYRMGYAIAFPESSMQGRDVPPALIDTTGPMQQAIYIDQNALANLGQYIIEMMQYWQQALDVWPLGEERLQQIVNLLCPVADYTPHWNDRIQEHTARWLVLTPQQSRYLERFQHQSKTIISGRSGTGKTLLAVTYAKQVVASGKRVLFLVYNAPLAEEIRGVLDAPLKNFYVDGEDIEQKITVLHYHALCRKAIQALGPQFRENAEWFNIAAPRALADAIKRGMMPDYDSLILDETQVFDPQWLTVLESWFSNKPILACCDETQVFSFEHHTPLHKLEEIMHTQAFTLTTNARSPYVIFERLQHVFPTSYEQFSPRPEETDALQEIASSDPLATLCEIIQQLHTEGVPSSSIMVIYTGKYAPEYPKKTLPFIPITTSVFRSRGLEMPVVIVWNSYGVDDTALACAYSRATSRCIAIYNVTYLLADDSLLEANLPKSVFLSLLRQKGSQVYSTINITRHQ